MFDEQTNSYEHELTAITETDFAALLLETLIHGVAHEELCLADLPLAVHPDTFDKGRRCFALGVDDLVPAEKHGRVQAHGLQRSIIVQGLGLTRQHSVLSCCVCVEYCGDRDNERLQLL